MTGGEDGAMREHILFFRDALLCCLEAEESNTDSSEEADLAAAGASDAD